MEHVESEVKETETLTRHDRSDLWRPKRWERTSSVNTNHQHHLNLQHNISTIHSFRYLHNSTVYTQHTSLTHRLRAGHFGAAISALTISALGHFGTDRYGAGRFGASAVCDGSSNVTQPFLRLSDFLNMPILSYLILSYLILPGSLYI